MTSLTIREQQQIEDQAVKSMRQNLDRDKPRLENYLVGETRATHYIQLVLVWAKFGVVVIAFFAGLASSIRTVQAASEIYSAAGSAPIGVALAAIAFTVSVEGALFVIALAQEGEHLKRRASNIRRSVISLKSLWYGIQVRIGLRDPLQYDELPEGGNLSLVMGIAFAFAVTANAYMGFRPMLHEIGSVSLQAFFATLWSSPATLQLTFLLDLAGILFPPLMALAAGHLTARFAAEIAQDSQAAKLTFERDLAIWRTAYAHPLNTEEGKRLMGQLSELRIQSKEARKVRHPTGEADFLGVQSHPNGKPGGSETG